MENKVIPVKYTVINNTELTGEEKIAYKEALKAISSSFAPHSGFRVGAAAILSDGTIINGSNQESDVYPSGMCAERVLLFNKFSNFPDKDIRIIAVTAENEDGPIKNEVFPCGMCTQTLVDAEKRQEKPFRILMAGSEKSIIIDSAKRLMPFQFTLK
ncbi:MAG: cytidine deaminase [Rikenellaceae bacterium]|nr:cytidine deaminase [Rikenellaceae bacterium]